MESANMRGFLGQNEFLLVALFFSETITGTSSKLNILILDFLNFFFVEEGVDLILTLNK